MLRRTPCPPPPLFPALQAIPVWLVILAIGVVAVLGGQLLGYLATLVGGQADCIAISFFQLTIALALFFGPSLGLRLPCLRWGSLGQCWAGVWVGVVAIGAAWGVTQLWVSFLASQAIVLPQQPSLEALRNAGPAYFAFLAISAGLWAPFVEEVYFRGWWQSWGATHLGLVRSILLISFAFAYLHGNLAVLPGLFVAGVIFGISSARLGVGSAIAAHIVFNLATIIAVRGGWV